jgi:hypothetical protein
MNVALMLCDIQDLAPDAGNLDQEHYNDLGRWLADTVAFFDSPAMVVDVATTGFNSSQPRWSTSRRSPSSSSATRLLPRSLLNRLPQNMIRAHRANRADLRLPPFPSKFLGCVQVPPGYIHPEPPERAKFRRAIFGWHPESMA